MKDLQKLLYIMLIATTLFSCEGKHNCNGDLDGNWQLTSWESNIDGSIKATNKDGIYYAVSLSLIKIWKTTNSNGYYLSDFERKNDSLFFTRIYASPFDSIVSFKDLKDYGMGDDGKFKIIKLNSNALVLSNRENTLTFRKY